MNYQASFGTVASSYYVPTGTAPSFGSSTISANANPAAIFAPSTQSLITLDAGGTISGTSPITFTAIFEIDGVEMVGQNNLTSSLQITLNFSGFFLPYPATRTVDVVELRASNGIAPDAVLSGSFSVTLIPEDL